MEQHGELEINQTFIIKKKNNFIAKYKKKRRIKTSKSDLLIGAENQFKE
jgi:hypothetical protein